MWVAATEALVYARICPRGICGGQNDSGASFFPSLSVFLRRYHSTPFHIYSRITWGIDKRPVSGPVPHRHNGNRTRNGRETVKRGTERMRLWSFGTPETRSTVNKYNLCVFLKYVFRDLCSLTLNNEVDFS